MRTILRKGFLLQTVDGKQLVVRLRSEGPPKLGDRPGKSMVPEDENAKLFVSSIPPTIQNDQLQVRRPLLSQHAS